MARTFNGTNQYGQVSRDYSAYSTLSVGGKVSFTSKPNPYGIIWEFTSDGASVAGGFNLYWNNGISALKVSHKGNVGGCDAEYGGATITNGQVYDLIGVYDFTQAASSEVNLYLDGALLTPSARPTNNNNTGAYASSTLNVAVRNAASLFCPITIERLWVYAGDVGADRAMSIARGASPVALLGAGLVDYWPLWGNDSPEPNYLGAGNITLTNTPTQAAGPSANRPFDGANWWPGAFTGTSPPPSTYIGARYKMIGAQQFSGGRAA